MSQVQNKRSEPRVPHSQKATLTFKGVSSSCVIQDFSMKGFLIMSAKPFEIGDVAELKSELWPGKFIECKIQVRRFTSDECLGTQIIEISEHSKRLCLQFVEEHYAQRLKYGR